MKQHQCSTVKRSKNCEDMAKAAFSGNLSESNLPTIKIDKNNFQKNSILLILIVVSNLENQEVK